ncbi:MAG: hypothetical protein R2761_14335 [Acidimicrobiales bacterium]
MTGDDARKAGSRSGGGASSSHPPLVERLRHLAGSGFFDLPPWGAGSSVERLDRLAGLARRDLELARLAEAHLDAVTILGEAGRVPHDGALYGVWASDAPHARLEARAVGAGWELSGRKAFCTGTGIVDRALVTAATGTAVLLIDVAVADGIDGIDGDGGDWITPAFASTNTSTLTFARQMVSGEAVIGPPDWYLERVGFWHGALAPAACWAGGAMGLADHTIDACRPSASGDDHVLARLGTLDAATWELDAVLGAAGRAIDRDPSDRRIAVDTAYRVRTIVERIATGVIDDATRAGGPRLLAYDRWASQRVAELQLYVRQHHDRRDHAALGLRRATRERDRDRGSAAADPGS